MTYSVYNDLALLWQHLVIEAILGRLGSVGSGLGSDLVIVFNFSVL